MLWILRLIWNIIGTSSFISRRHRWTLMIISQIIEIVIGGIFLFTEIYPEFNESKRFPERFENPEGYRKTAYAYIWLFSIEVLMDIAFWMYVVQKRGEDISVVISLLSSVVCEIPLMMCGTYLMKAKRTINWDDEKVELLFQIWCFINIMVHIIANTAERVYYWGVIIIAPFSYLIACMLYAFVIIPMSGWHWLPSFPDSHQFLHGTFNSTITESMLFFLVLSGFVGQWLWRVFSLNAILICCLIVVVKYGNAI